MAEVNKSIDLTGMIMVTESDRWGKPLEIAVETDDFQTYIITGRKRGKELFSHISKRITLNARVEGTNYYGNTLISILDYNLEATPADKNELRNFKEK